MVIGIQPPLITFLVDNRSALDGHLYSACTTRVHQIGYFQPTGVSIITTSPDNFCPGGDIVATRGYTTWTFERPRLLMRGYNGALICLSAGMNGKMLLTDKELTAADAVGAMDTCNRILKLKPSANEVDRT